MVFGWAPGWLLSRSNWWVDIQVMTDKVRINSWASQASQANMSTFFWRNSISACFSWEGNCTPTWKNFSGLVSMITFSKSSQLASSAGPPLDEVEAFDCYRGFSTKSEGTTLSLCKMAATMHCLATDWLPKIYLTRPSEGYFTFWCKVEETAPRAWSQGLATMAV